MKGLIEDSVRDNIIKMHIKGMSCSDIRDILDVSRSTVFRVINAYKIVDSGDIAVGGNTICNTTDLEWASKKLGKPIPMETETEEIKSEKPQPKKDEDQNTVQAFISIMSALNANLEAQLAALSRIAGSVNNLCDKLGTAGQGIEKIVSVNTDIISEEQHKQTDILNGIKMNTRKKGLANAE